jgi:hypothetical protein
MFYDPSQRGRGSVAMARVSLSRRESRETVGVARVAVRFISVTRYNRYI